MKRTTPNSNAAVLVSQMRIFTNGWELPSSQKEMEAAASQLKLNELITALKETKLVSFGSCTKKKQDWVRIDQGIQTRLAQKSGHPDCVWFQRRSRMNCQPVLRPCAKPKVNSTQNQSSKVLLFSLPKQVVRPQAPPLKKHQGTLHEAQQMCICRKAFVTKLQVFWHGHPRTWLIFCFFPSRSNLFTR